MKKLISKLPAIALLSLSFNTFAQGQPQNENPYYYDPDETYVSATLLHGFFGTLNKVSLENKIYQMKLNGQTTAQFKMAIGINGQIFDMGDLYYESEMSAGGYKVIPFNIVLAESGRVFLDISPVEFYIRDEIGQLSLQLLSFEYKKDFDYSSQAEFYISLIEASATGTIVNNDSIKLSGNLGIDLGLPAFYRSETWDKSGDLGFGQGLNYGINSQIKMNHGNSILLGINGELNRAKYANYIAPEYHQEMEANTNQYWATLHQIHLDQAAWDQAKFDWEVANGYGYTVENTHYIQMSGVEPRPVDISGPDQWGYSQNLIRKWATLNPMIGYSKEFKNGNAASIELNANLFLTDKFEGKKDMFFDAGSNSYQVDEFVKDDLLAGRSLNTYNVKLVFTFGNTKK